MPGAGVYAELRRRQPVLAGMALVFLLAMIPTVFAMQFDERTVNDVNVWVKPAKFLFSLAVYYATIGWYFGYLSVETQRTRPARFIIWATITVGVLEILWLVLAAVYGVAAHFNRESIVWSIAYSVAGVGATVLLMGMFLQARLISRAALPGVPPLFRLGLVAGTYVACVATLFTASVLAGGTGHWVGGANSDLDGLPVLGWSRSGGDLRVPHFWALHAHQLVPLLVWVLCVKLGWVQGRLGVLVIVAIYVVFVIAVFVQALSGQPFPMRLGEV